jgi:hypothetical protein
MFLCSLVAPSFRVPNRLFDVHGFVAVEAISMICAAQRKISTRFIADVGSFGFDSNVFSAGFGENMGRPRSSSFRLLQATS